MPLARASHDREWNGRNNRSIRIVEPGVQLTSTILLPAATEPAGSRHQDLPRPRRRVGIAAALSGWARPVTWPTPLHSPKTKFITDAGSGAGFTSTTKSATRIWSPRLNWPQIL